MGFSGISQTKIEIEQPISKDSVPELAKSYISTNYNPKKIKWILEQNAFNTSIEAKFCLNKEKYSVEFNTDGTLQDVEIIKKFKTLEKSLQLKISSHLEELFVRHRILKLQIQYIKGLKNTANTNYEMVVLGKTTSKKSRYELTYNYLGEFIAKSEITEKPLIYLQN